jgi:hypothetical protein
MTTVAQHYQPDRPIAVGNRHRCSILRRTTAHRIAPRLTSTFPSLVGSFESRLVVGNRQHHVRLRDAPFRILSPRCVRQHISTNTKLSSDRIRAVIGGLVPLSSPCATSIRQAALHVATHLNELRYPASSAFGPSAVGISPFRFASLRCAPHLSTLRLASSQRIPAKRRLPSGNLRFAGTNGSCLHDAALVNSTSLISTAALRGGIPNPSSWKASGCRHWYPHHAT